MLGLALNPIHSVEIWGNGARPIRVITHLSSDKGDNVTGSFRRRIAAILALAMGFGVVMSSSPAAAAPVHRASHTTIAPAGTHAGSGMVTAADWWW
jgi:hypothetical protein